jgi:hypothetical protein
MKCFGILFTIVLTTVGMFAQDSPIRSINLSNVRCGQYPTTVTVRFFTTKSDTSPKWEGTIAFAAPQSEDIDFPLADTALLDAFSTESIGWYSLQCVAEQPFPMWKLPSVAYSAHSMDASTLAGKPASAYALASSVDTSGVTASLSNETSRAQLIEGNLALDLANAQSSIQIAASKALANEGAIATEATRAQSTESSLASNLAGEVTNRQQAINALMLLVTDLQAQLKHPRE